MAIARVNGVKLYYEQVGEGPRVVLTHGAYGDARSWQSVIGPLAEGFEVVTWDRRGHSRSEDGEGPGSRHEDAADLAALIERLGPQRAHVYGSSMGGTIVLTLVAERPDLVLSAAVHEPAVMGLLAQSEDPSVATSVARDVQAIEAVRDRIEQGKPEEGTRMFVELALGPGTWEQLPEASRQIFTANAHTFLDESRSLLEMCTVDTAALAASTVPLMITYGTTSPELERLGALEIGRRVPSARVEVLDGAGHVPYRSHPALWLATLRAFLARHVPEAVPTAS